MKDVMSTGLVLFCSAVAVVLTVDKFCQFFSEFSKISSKIQSERKLLDRCNDPEFFMDLHTHTDVCIAVQYNARAGAFMLALEKVMGASHLEGAVSEMSLAARALGWPILAIGLVVLMACPSLCMSFARRRECGQRAWRYREHDA